MTTLRRISARQATHAPRNSAESMIWDNRRRLQATAAKPPRLPIWGDTIVREPGTVPDDEVDAGFYGALVLPMKVGDGHGEVPMMVAMRLHKAGLVRLVAANDNGVG